MSNTFFGCAIFLITNISLLYTSHLCVRRFHPHAPPSVRLVAIGLLYYSLIILIFQALSPFHAITRTWVTISCILLALISHLIWGKQRNIQADIEPIKSWIREGLSSRWSVLLIICGFIVLLSFSRALLMPPLAWDCLTYHLTSAALWIKKGTLLIFNAPDQLQYTRFPINGEIFAAWLLLPFDTDLLLNTMNFPITLLGGISCYAIARELGLTRKEASFAPALVCFSPMIYPQITTEYIDNAVFTLCSASVLFTLRFLRRGYLNDCLLALVAAGTLLGTKYSGIPAVGLIFIATVIKIINLVKYSGLLKKFSLILLGLLIICTLGGRQYIHNTIEAGNPLYPFHLKLFNHEICEGWSRLDQVDEWISIYEVNTGLDKLSWWERTYRKFCYISLTAGPKFLIFLILAFISLFTKPHYVPKSVWYFLSIMWIVPIVLFYADTSVDFAKRGYYLDRSTRFLSPYIAIFAVQGLVILQKLSKHFKKIDFFLVAFVAWDLLYINKTHIWEVEVLYPPIIVALFMIGVISILAREKSSKSLILKVDDLANYVKSTCLDTFRVSSSAIKKWVTYTFGFIVLIGALSLLQVYRDTNRYVYYRNHRDLNNIPRMFVNAWEFLDQPATKTTIALAIGWEPPGHKWFFYPLLGRWLQNDIVYISAKYKWEVPTWLDRGLLRGDDFSIWVHNLRRKKVDYILVQKPWPVELRWMLRHQDKFQLVFDDRNCKIFKYTGERT
ncbi:MAG: hypothetical protein AMJ42_00720 [Deltaproteobacteria bacterium DG_8]|nr:MAG: hypothetical protein AMJ42_00720 [Deltaproteobacteria bacterium DG_8]